MGNNRDAETTDLPPKQAATKPKHVLEIHCVSQRGDRHLPWFDSVAFGSLHWLWHHGETQVTCCLGKFLYHLILKNQSCASQEPGQFWHQSNLSLVFLLQNPHQNTAWHKEQDGLSPCAVPLTDSSASPANVWNWDDKTKAGGRNPKPWSESKQISLCHWNTWFLWEAETGLRDSAPWCRTALIHLDHSAKGTGAIHPSLPAPSKAGLNQGNLGVFAPHSLLLNLKRIWSKAMPKASKRGCFSARRCKSMPKNFKKTKSMKVRIFLVLLEMALHPSSRCLRKDHRWVWGPGMAPQWVWDPSPVSSPQRSASPWVRPLLFACHRGRVRIRPRSLTALSIHAHSTDAVTELSDSGSGVSSIFCNKQNNYVRLNAVSKRSSCPSQSYWSEEFQLATHHLPIEKKSGTLRMLTARGPGCQRHRPWWSGRPSPVPGCLPKRSQPNPNVSPTGRPGSARTAGLPLTVAFLAWQGEMKHLTASARPSCSRCLSTRTM